ncbi:MAG TPA: MgtC/SapB family protein [Tepidisphaeraceae bacterium]|jgi:putative Mg2+ transporter-C (MgtC) family protein|nr:MgtC/SapB family protein [Tepidisphaeraceae bacterium]
MEWLNLLDQQLVDWGRSLGYATESAFRLIFAMLCGGVIGIERQLRGREAGFRTHALVCLGSALVMIVSIHFAFEPWQPQNLSSSIELQVDPARIAYGVMTGIGFLGAGSILKNNGSVQGLTTAAGLWCVAAMGLAAGFGQYAVTLVATALILITLWVLDYIGNLFPNQHRYDIVIRRRWTPGCLQATVDRMDQLGVDVFDAFIKRSDDLQYVDITMSIAVTGPLYGTDLENKVEGDGDHWVLSTREG